MNEMLLDRYDETGVDGYVQKNPSFYIPLYTPFIAVYAPMYTRYTCIYTTCTPNTPLNTL